MKKNKYTKKDVNKFKNFLFTSALLFSFFGYFRRLIAHSQQITREKSDH